MRAAEIVPRLPGMAPGGQYRLLGRAALSVDWRLGDGSTLRLLANFADDEAALSEPAAAAGRLLYCTSPEAPDDRLPAGCGAFYLLLAEAAALR